MNNRGYKSRIWPWASSVRCQTRRQNFLMSLILPEEYHCEVALYLPLSQKEKVDNCRTTELVVKIDKIC